MLVASTVYDQSVGVLAVVGPLAGSLQLVAVHKEIVVVNYPLGTWLAERSRLVHNESAAQHAPVGARAGSAEVNGDGVGPGTFGLGESDGRTTAAALLYCHVHINVCLVGVVLAGRKVVGGGYQQVFIAAVVLQAGVKGE